ncbi:PBSX family phage terminase large subunit [Lapidilactobacillus gannanensis]|uniref:PBSX family phage terminase large subunit n=1 Tax=Lapidilactobacillus gannanensis TaxID=2486002 RepID=A0ABW4BMN2_9LACO|nr:PBSX family phage terminase large subunit [Lapidilactobacillus gannanensis]
MTSNEIKLSSLVQPHFRRMWRSNASYFVLNGGRGSFKSSTVSLKLCVMMKKQTQQGHKANVIIIRENATNLRDSVYEQIIWALGMLDMTDEFICRTTPLRIFHRRTKSTFYFYGADKPERLKSNSARDVIAIWYEEAANFKGPEVFDQSNPTFIRQKSPYVDKVPVYYTYNPPKNPYDWINRWVTQQELNPDCLVDKSTYLDDELGFTVDQQLALIEQYKKNDPDYYRWLYLGEEIGLGTNIYNMDLFHVVNKLDSGDPILYMAFSVDTGHAQSATALTAYGITAKLKVYVLDTFYYSPAHQSVKKAPSQLTKEIHDFIAKTLKQYPNAQVIKRTIDSADGAMRNQYYYDYRVRWSPVKKLEEKDMIDYPQSLLAQGRVFVLDVPGNKIFLEEHRKYQWDEKTVQSDKPRVIKEDDHTCDNFKYFCLSNAKFLNLKV